MTRPWNHQQCDHKDITVFWSTIYLGYRLWSEDKILNHGPEVKEAPQQPSWRCREDIRTTLAAVHKKLLRRCRPINQEISRGQYSDRKTLLQWQWAETVKIKIISHGDTRNIYLCTTIMSKVELQRGAEISRDGPLCLSFHTNKFFLRLEKSKLLDHL